jgi:hypothetical protein
MILSDMLLAFNDQTDDFADTTTIVRWLNFAQNDMATVVEAKFPQLDPSNMNDTFVFDEKFHELPIMYAVAKFKAADTSDSEANLAMQEYLDKRTWFMANYKKPMRYNDEATVQQFVATAGQTVFTITDTGYDYRTGNLKVYVNDVKQPKLSYKYDRYSTFTLLTACNDGDCVTAEWEEHSEMEDAPYGWKW